MSSPAPPSSHSDALFQSWLELLRQDPGADPETWLAQQPTAYREELRRLVEDYQTLQEAVASDGPSFEPGRALGDFRLVQELGRGGMGSVWEAEQISLKRHVALKLLKPQFSFSPRCLQRFQREAEAGGRLQHPGIVKTYGVGKTEGIHWIAQELVPGGFTLADGLAGARKQRTPPTNWYRGVAELFAKVAEALGHAHAQGVIHRDVKPGNLLITEGDEPKVADFGLAQVQDDLGLSRTGDFLGTPFYMSPEQAASKRMGLDERTDIFSLGATLYEALALVRAFDGDTSQQVFQKILTEDPMDPKEIRSRVPKDLAVICGKCLEKSPDKRYQSMQELAADLRRHLANEPILAKPPGRIERAVKWCKRHPVVTVSGAVAAAALVTISGLAWRISQEQARTEAALARTQEAEAQAVAAQAQTEERANELQRVTDFQASQLEALDAEDLGWGVRRELFERLNDPDNGPRLTSDELEAQRKHLEQGLVGLDFTGLGMEILHRYFFSGALEAIAKLADQPKVQAQLLDTLGNVMREAGLLDQAEGPLRRALGLRTQALGENDPLTLTSVNDLASLLKDQGELKEAESLFRMALEKRQRILGEAHQDTLASLNNLGLLLWRQGRLDEAEPLIRQSLEGYRQVLGEDHPDTLASLNNLGLLLCDHGKYPEAEPLMRQALEARRQVLGEDHPDTLVSLDNVALLLQDQGKLDEAEPLMRQALARKRRVLGKNHPITLTSLNNLAMLLYARGELSEAELLMRQALEARRQVLGEDHPDTLASVNNLGLVLWDCGKPSEAEPLLREALEGQRRVLGEDHPNTLIMMSNFSGFLWNKGQLTEAESLYRKVLNGCRHVLGEDHPNTLTSLNNLAGLLQAQGKLDEAEPLLRQALEGQRRVLGSDHPDTLGTLGHLAQVELHLGRPEKAFSLAKELLERSNETDPRYSERVRLLADIQAILGGIDH